MEEGRKGKGEDEEEGWGVYLVARAISPSVGRSALLRVRLLLCRPDADATINRAATDGDRLPFVFVANG